MPDKTEEGQVQEGQSLRGNVVAVEAGRIEVFDGKCRYWVTPSIAVRLGQVIDGTVRSVQGKLILEVTVLPPPTQEEIAASEKAASAAQGKVMDVAKHNASISFLARCFKKTRVKVMWGVFSNSNELVALFEYPHRGEAEAYAAQLTDERKVTFYVTQVRQLMK